MNTAAAPIEDFLEAITAQLDKTQDALRLKAVNRPLTFALKDFNIDLSVFVEMDVDGMVRLRPSGPNETGASSIQIGFTTITRPMIEENTISLDLAQSPSLEEADLAPEESIRLQRLGVRNTAQLERLRRHFGDDGVARFSGVDAGRLRQALQTTGPRIDYVDIGAGRRAELKQGNGSPPTVPIRPGQRRLRLRGNGLTEPGLTPKARLDGMQLPIRASSFSHIDLELPDESSSATGRVDVELPDGHVESFDIVLEGNGSVSETAQALIPDEGGWSVRSDEERDS